MIPSSHIALAIGALALGAFASPAGAAPSDRAADLAYKEGRRHYDLREWDQAIAAFKESYRLRGDERSLFNIAQAYRLEGDCVEALDFYKTYKRNFPRAAGIPAVDKLILEVQACAREKAVAPPPEPPQPQPQPLPVPAPHATAPVEPTPAPPPPEHHGSFHLASGLTAGAGVVALAGGTLYALHGRSLSHEAESGSGSFDMSLASDGHAANRDAAILFVASGALLATSAVLYIIGRPDEVAHVALAPTPTGGVLTWRASF
jgi:tetratricopeptide (TPR) repeat protein